MSEKLTRETCPHPQESRFIDELDGVERCGYLIGQWPYVAHPVKSNREEEKK